MNLAQRVRALGGDIRHGRADVAADLRQIAQWRTELAEAKHAEHHIPLPRFGVDYAWGRPTPAALRAHGVTFAARYLTEAGETPPYSTASKALTPAEARALSRAGIPIVGLYEQAGEAMAGGEASGREDAARARVAARAVGMPRGRPIYFVCDYDADPNAGPLAYLRGAARELGREYQAAIYGGYAVVRAALEQGYTHFGYQTLAWSHGAWEPRSQVRQERNGAPFIEGVECDTDYAYAADFGQWRV